ncbi:MAG TPA: FtsK/SpoIIIE domain-containing protein, partial [Gemmataceae bacterium]|nr:FtsK/SpoIIIE domain-containing protein [Gemmataceae bacterium]
QAWTLLQKWQQSTEPLDAPPQPVVPLRTGVEDNIRDAQVCLVRLRRLIVPRLLCGSRFVLLCLAFGLSVCVPAGFLVAYLANIPMVLGLAFGLVAALAAAAIGHPLLTRLATVQVDRHLEPLIHALDEAEYHCRRLLEDERVASERLTKQASETYFHALGNLQQGYEDKKQRLREQRRQAHQEARERSLQRTREAKATRDADLRKAKEWHISQRTDIELRAQAERLQQDTAQKALLAQLQQSYEQGWAALQEQWHSGLAAIRDTVEMIRSEDSRMFPTWDDAAWKDWQPPTAPPPVLRFGQFAVCRQLLPDGLPTDSRLGDAWLDDFTLPAALPFPEQYGMVFESGPDGREPAVAAVQAMLYRLLTVVPPGKVRFSIIDPVGLGENFAGFMHLSDYDPLLVTSRIWTEPAHIEQRLADLTAHMENVIQKYLRNKYPTITAYNAEAGEVAEPFRVLVVADFPVNFTDAAARRLVSICQNGARCGVTTLVTVDTRQPLPRGFDLADLEKAGATLVWKQDRFHWQDEDFGHYPLTHDRPPAEDQASALLERIGALAREARRVEVPFEFVAPAPDAWWTTESRTGITVGLGRSGATRRELLQLGKGTSQHGLVAGKTGSGKSTLLHALIVNVALHYSPREIELYLIDFKKGVEFKTYAVNELPHARVVAIESEREFGLSVLQRLDAELTWRGERFREAGVQDINSYRLARPGAQAPRILLIVDEFQEFFTEDDRIAQEAAQLLDRLVRQGRAFGLHVLLGSQTLGGAYSLARSTIDQMAVRIALQCSESDAHLILSADNSAARLLTRPGEAIYNDANGLVEGNSPFQVVWLPEHKRDEYLRQVRDRARDVGWTALPAVFEGNAPAEVKRNEPLRVLLHTPTWPAATASPARQTWQAWLGEAMSITGHTAALFHRQNGSNLAIVGPQPEAALGMLTVALISLAGALPPVDRTTTFFVIDASQGAVPDSGPLGRLPSLVPHGVRLAGTRDLPGLVAEVG